MGAMPPHIRPSHCVFDPACDPLEKSAGRGCAVTVSVALRLEPACVATMFAVNDSAL